jgi:DNA-binding MarR family transcriptional regulator
LLRSEVRFVECTEEVKGDGINSWLVRMIHSYASVNFKKFKELGIHPGQLPVLRTVYDREGISLRELANAIHVKPPTVTVTIQRLEKAGLVYKKADPADQRVSRIYLTEEGKNIHEEIQRLIDENEQLLIQGFSEEELELLCSFLERMTNNLRREI